MLSAAVKMASIRASILSRRSLEGPGVGSITPAVTSLFIRHCQSQRPVAVPLQLPSAAHASPQQPPPWLRLARNCSTQAAATSPAATAAALAPENIRRLVRSICVCTTPAQLRWLAQTETAEDRLQQAEQLPELLDHLEYNLNRYAPGDVIKMLTYMAACRAPCQDLLTEVVPLLYNSLGSLAPGELVMLLSTYITGGVYQQELFAAVTEFVYEGVGRLSAMEVSEVAWSYAVADHYDDDEDLFRALGDRALVQLQDHSPESLAQLLWSLGMLRFRHDPLCEAAVEQLSQHGDQWPLSSVGLALWGMAEVQHAVKPEVFDRLTQNLSMRLLRYRTSTDGQQLGASVGGIVRSKAGAVQTVTTSLPLLRIGRQTSLTPSGGAGDARSSSSFAWEEGAAAAASSSGEVETPFIGFSGEGFPAEDPSSSADGAPAATAEAAAAAGVAEHVPAVSSTSGDASPSHAGPAPTPVGPRSGDGDSSAVSGSNGTAAQAASPAVAAAAAADGAPKQPPPPRGPVRRTAMMQAAILAAGTPGDHSRVVKVRVPSTLLMGYELVEIPALITNSIPFSSMADTVAAITQQVAESGAPATSTITSSSEEGMDAIAAAGSMGGSNGLPEGAAGQQQRGFSTSTSPSTPVVPRGAPDSSSKDAPWHAAGRMQGESLEALPGALVRIVWSAAMLSGPTITSAIFRECFALLGLFNKEAFADGQLALLWAAHMRVRELNHPLREAHLGLTDSYKLYAAKISRVAPGNLGLHTLQQPLAAACWLASTMHPDARVASFSSWRYRNPAVLSQAGMVASVTEALHRLPGASHPLQQVTLDGCYQLPLVSKVRGASVAWELLPPADCSRNPPHGPMAAAMARAKGLEYRGYTIVQVPFHEWAATLEAADPAMAATDYLKRKLAAAPLPQPSPAGV